MSSSAKLKTNETNIKDVLDAFVDAHGLREKLLETELQQKWEQVAGSTIARYTKRFYVKKKVLYLEVTVPVIKQEIAYSKTKLIENINTIIGRDFIKDLVLI